MNLKARFIVPVDAPVIEDGVLTFERGRITAVAVARDLPAAKAVDYGDAVIIPGLVNAHTHLELSLLAGRVPPGPDFVDWLHRLIAARAADMPPERTSPATEGSLAANYVARALRKGAAESVSHGVTTVGDISAFPGWTRPALSDSLLRAVSFGEVAAIGNRRAALARRLDAAADHEHQSPTLRIGLSPHAPYTVEPDALRACAARASALNAPLCIHAAETQEEGLFTRHGTGPLAGFLRDLGIWDDDIPVSGCSPIELCAAAGLLGPRTILAHANYVSDADIDAIARSEAGVAHCPRTHAAFGHAPHRFRDMLRAGVNVCLGTDSLASNPSLSILEEVRFLRERCHDVTPMDWLGMATLRGARALGFADTVGSLTPGKAADCVVLPLPTCVHPTWESVLDAPVIPLAVYVAGVRSSSSFYC